MFVSVSTDIREHTINLRVGRTADSLSGILMRQLQLLNITHNSQQIPIIKVTTWEIKVQMLPLRRK
jgi:hypothetical protein